MVGGTGGRQEENGRFLSPGKKPAGTVRAGIEGELLNEHRYQQALLRRLRGRDG